MVSDLVSAVDRIVPFAQRALEEVLEGDADQLEGVIRRLYELIADISKFLCAYTKRGRACECPIFYDSIQRLTSRIVHTLKSTVLPEDQFTIKNLQDKFSLLEKDFDRAVGVETLALVRKNGMFRHCSGVFLFLILISQN